MRTRIAALYIHGDRSSRPEDAGPTPMLAMPRLDVVEGRGIRQDRRYFRTWQAGRERKRQVSLIDEGTIRRHEAVFGSIERNLIKSQVILDGDIHLPDLSGVRLRCEGGAELEITVERRPCFAMDFIVPGLRDAMQNGEQGALARVVHGGELWVGQTVDILIESGAGHAAS
ncbi:MAG TPA: hypothetical protein VFB58_17325 [Chloroflexota bacterium]|nr:hypothetical protein [Chloroflexota bacterium]